MNSPPDNTTRNRSPRIPNCSTTDRAARRQLVGGARQHLAGDGVAVGIGARHQAGHRRNRLAPIRPRVDLGDQALDAIGAGMTQHQRGQRGLRPAAIAGADHGLQRQAGHPERRPFVAVDFAPAARPGGDAAAVDAVGDRPGTGDDDDTGLLVGAGDQRHQRIVHRQRLAAEAEPAQDRGDHLAIVGAIHPRHAHAHHAGQRAIGADRLLDHLVEHLLGPQFAGVVNVAAAAAPLAEHVALGIGEPRHGLAAAGVDSEHVHDRSLYWPACWVSAAWCAA